MKAAEVLFHQFPRWIGPQQRMVYNRKELLQQMFQRSGNENCFTSVYTFPFGNNVPLIDKIYFDFDGDLEESHKNGQILFEWYKENHFEPIPVWTGGRGAHIYPRCINTIVDNPSEFIKRAVYFGLEETGLYTEEVVDDDTFKIPVSDSKVIGDIRRLTRYIGTQRASNSGVSLPTFCVALDPERYLDMSLKEILEFEKDPTKSEPDIITKPTRSFAELNLKSINLKEWKSPDIIRIKELNNLDTFTTADEITTKIVKALIPRPCIHNNLLHPKCPDLIRFAGTCELKHRGMTSDFIIKLFAKIGWENFNLLESGRQVQIIHNKDNMTTVGKQKMIENGFCIPTDSECCRSCR